MTNPAKLYEQLVHNTFLIAGPCVIENEEVVMEVAGKIKAMAEKQNISYIFKASFDKANRTSLDSFRGLPFDESMRILQKVKDKYDLPVLTDIHESHQAAEVARVADVLQIPAFLCRQTDLLTAAAETGRIVNIKKAQFLSGADMQHPAEKVKEAGNQQILLTERGNMFGYNNLVVDFFNIVHMKELGYPVVMDVTHATQKPGGMGGKSGGNRRFAPYLARAAAATGVDGFFFEVHPDPDSALSDGPNMIKLSDFEKLLEETLNVKNAG